jgi:hypothetical protein
MDIRIENFGEIPARRGGGGGRQAGDLLQKVRSLVEGQKAVVSITASDFGEGVRKITASLKRKGALDWKPTLRSNIIDRQVEIYRGVNSGFAFDTQGNPVLSDPNAKGMRRHLSKAEVAKN